MASLTATAEANTLRDMVEDVAGIKANGHAKMLIVGVRGDNMPQQYREIKQVLFWEGGDADRLDIPAAVKLILTTRFMGHTGFGRLKRHAEHNNVAFYSRPMGTGEIKRLLAPLLPPDKTAEEPDIVPAARARKPTQFGKGDLLAFCGEHADLSVKPLVKEARRLFAAASAAGIKTTEGSISQAIYLLRTRAGRTPPPPPPIRPFVEPAPVADVIVTPFVPTPPAPEVSGILTEDAELLRMLDENQKALERIAESMDMLLATNGLLRETIAGRAAREATLAKVREMMKGL